MRTGRICFNLVLAAFVLNCGCASDRSDRESRRKEQDTINHVRVHLESRHDIPERAMIAKVGGSDDLRFAVEKMPILTELHVEKASLLEDLGGFKVELDLNPMGARILESYSSAAMGRHLLIMTELDGEATWIAAPIIEKRISDGILAFTPIASREDMNRLVTGLNQAVEKRRKRWLD